MSEICLDEALRGIGIYPTSIEVERECGTLPRLRIYGIFNPADIKKQGEEKKGEQKEVQMEKKMPAVKRILKNGDYMTVLWEDGKKTIVKRAEDEPESDYAAFTAALGIKVFGTNSALKKVVASAEWQHKKKQKKEEKT